MTKIFFIIDGLDDAGGGKDPAPRPAPDVDTVGIDDEKPYVLSVDSADA